MTRKLEVRKEAWEIMEQTQRGKEMRGKIDSECKGQENRENVEK